MIQVQNQQFNGKTSGKRISECKGIYRPPFYVNTYLYASIWNTSGLYYNDTQGDYGATFGVSPSGNDLYVTSYYGYAYYDRDYNWVTAYAGGAWTGVITYTVPPSGSGNYYISVSTNLGPAGNYNVNYGSVITYNASGVGSQTVSFYAILNYI